MEETTITNGKGEYTIDQEKKGIIVVTDGEPDDLWST